MADPLIGQSPLRVGGRERVTGAQQYIADIHLENVLHVKLVHLGVARARIDRIDVAEALKVPGVRRIVTPADLPVPMPRFGPAVTDRPLLAVGETKFFGEPVAAVVAETIDAAEDAAALVRVVSEELPAVLTVDQALAPGAPLVQDPALRGKGPLAQTNRLNEWTFGWGDVDAACADLVLEHDYEFPMITHFAIEPHGYMAAPDEHGVTIWSPMQHPFVLQRVVAAALGWPISRVRVISPDPGGGFGGKGWPKFEPLMAYLALEVGRPVRLILTLEETFQQVRRTSATVRARTGFTSDGRIVFQDLEGHFLLGAYADIGIRVVSKASYAACGPYHTPNARVIARAILSHTTPTTAFRGFGTPQASWAVESQLTKAARLLGLDPAEIRLRNVPAKGEAFIPNDTPADGDWGSAIRKATAAADWHRPLPKHRGRGISLGLKSSSTASASLAIVRLHYDGSATILSGTSDMGQGARTVFAQIAAQELGLKLDEVAVVMGDTAVVPYDSSTSASRSTVFMGNAILKACAEIRRRLRTLAAEAFALDEERIQVEPGRVRLPDRELSYVDVLKARFGPPRGELIGVGEERGGGYVPTHPLGGRPEFWEFMCSAAEVEVDPEVGTVEIVKLVLASDIGHALNPQQVEAQDEGAAVMGLGHSLMEHLILNEHGRILNLGALDYRIPTVQDVPRELHSILIENHDGPGPYGAKGAGEGGILAIAAAIGAAIGEAVGVEIRDLPLTPERIWRAIQEKQNQQEAEKPTLTR
ncbi:MAG: xanthine dehydrogenase family protein [Acidobacteria bacterium]|nr:xanthine dehydrogenase family protein [Acidobacteriota bacterium]